MLALGNWGIFMLFEYFSFNWLINSCFKAKYLGKAALKSKIGYYAFGQQDVKPVRN